MWNSRSGAVEEKKYKTAVLEKVLRKFYRNSMSEITKGIFTLT
jgi:hypothetical protein